ncbi:hypothetical protein ZHAS_00013027 [Anopheles sinensis]|uniref:C2H2-type domain-containing protein n=1 Tax=Anopheles sinensis TaxID=74873 RepID=A0A084W4G3_ANOSI|nr:hypothetical protein ZHAS_00013027 [Anopheles sinensis]
MTAIYILIVRLEDWFAFREQCLGSDEYLRVALAHIYADVQAPVQPPPTTSHTGALNNGVSYTQQHRPQTNESSSRPSPAPPTSVSPTDGTPSSAPRSSSLAKRRRSIFEWSVDDGKGQATGQKVIVELLDDGVVPSTGESVSPPKRNDHQQSYEPILPSERPNGGETPGVGAVLPEDASGLLEQATWSKEYCARVNSLMVLVTGTRPYKCKICRKLFKARSNLRRHIKVNHADEVFEGESPPPECYDFGHIDRAGGAAFWKPPPQLPGAPDSFPSVQQQLLQQQHQQQQRPVQNVVHHSTPDGGPVKKKRRSANDPPITGPYHCQICPRSFKMPAHLAVHMKTHQRVEAPVVPSAIELQVQQQLLQRQSRTRTNIEPTDIIQLSDDDDDDNEEEQRKQQQQQDVSRQSDELDDGFDEEEGSLKEGASSDRSGEQQLQPDPASMANVELGPIKTQPIEKEEEDDDDDVVIQDVKPAPQPPPPPTEVQVKPKRIPAPGTIPPGPLSMKQRYRASMENGGALASRTQSPLETKPKPFQFIVARPKHSPVPSTSTPPPSPVASESQSSPPVTTTLHRCHFCQQTFSRDDLLREHQKTHQRDAPMPFRCRWCQKGFRYRQNYTLHVEKQTCRLLNGEAGGGASIKPPSSMMARPIAVANKPRGAAAW